MRKYHLTFLTVGFVGLISCTEYRIIPLSARTENDVLRMPVSSAKFLMRLFCSVLKQGQLCGYQEIGLDGGYDIGAAHRGLEILDFLKINLLNYQSEHWLLESESHRRENKRYQYREHRQRRNR